MGALQELQDEDDELVSERSIFNPKSSMKPWRFALQSAGLQNSFESAFQREWEDLMKNHLSSVNRWCPHSLCTVQACAKHDQEVAQSYGHDGVTWQRPSLAALEKAMSISSKDDHYSRSQQVIDLGAHFDALGRCAWSKDSGAA